MRQIHVADLFSGVGGLTFGFTHSINNNRFVPNSSFKINFANEFEHNASDAFKKNFPEIPMVEDDIQNLNFKSLSDKGIDIDGIDLVVGGPPCQSFSTVGKRQYDARARMYTEYRRMLTIIQPKMFVFENVVGITTMKNDVGEPVLEDVKKSFADFSDFNMSLGYSLHTKILDSSDFGVPQTRHRFFIVGIRNDLHINSKWSFPEPLKVKKVTVADAISDLPNLDNGGEARKYTEMPKNRYQKLMRGTQQTLLNHKNSLNGEKIRTVMANVVEGEGRDYINALVDSGQLDSKYYLTSGYRNSYGRLWWNKPASTITNNLGTPSSFRCIHPKQDRALTSREGARLQSFPDSFVFVGGKGQVNKQIGNAVPPLLAMSLAKRVIDFFDKNDL